MEFGLVLSQVGARWEHLEGDARAAEEAGLDSVWLVDHLLATLDPERGIFEAWTALAALTGRTERVRLGQLVTCVSFRNVGLLAMMASTLDHASGGRLELGLGAGWFEAEYRAFGYPFPSPGNRRRALAETLEALDLLFAGRPVDLEGLKSAEGDAIAKLAAAACEAEKLKFTPYDFQNEAMFRSDGASFLRKSVPAIMFFTSWHDDYHRVGDHPEKIEYARMAQIGRAAARILFEVANLEKVPAFNKETPLGGGGGGKQLGINGEELDEKGRAGAKLEEGVGGYLLTSIVEGSVAAKAGIKEGDIIVGFGGKPLPATGTLTELRKRIRAAKDGEEVDVEIVRGGEKQTVKAVWPKK